MSCTAVSETAENYLKLLWQFEEEGVKLVRITEMGSKLDVSPSTAVEMLKKLEEKSFIVYEARRGVMLTKKGREIGRRITRNHRLIELLMQRTLRVSIDEGEACGMEHHMDKKFADALCTLLGHPDKCPHGKPIPSCGCH